MKKYLSTLIAILTLGFSQAIFAGNDNQEIKLIIDSNEPDYCFKIGFETTDVGSTRYSSSSCTAEDDYKFGPKNYRLIYNDNHVAPLLDYEVKWSCNDYFNSDQRTPDGNGTLTIHVKAIFDDDANTAVLTDCAQSWQPESE